MLPSLNYDSNDPKFSLLSEIFKIIGSKKVLDIYNRNAITNRKMMDLSIKVIFISMFFDYPISKNMFIKITLMDKTIILRLVMPLHL